MTNNTWICTWTAADGDVESTWEYVDGDGCFYATATVYQPEAPGPVLYAWTVYLTRPGQDTESWLAPNCNAEGREDSLEAAQAKAVAVGNR